MTPIDKRVYPEMDKFWADLGNAYKKAVRGFADAGCRYLQLDEVFIAMLCDPKYLGEQMTKAWRRPPGKARQLLYADLINAAMSDIPRDMTITMHLVPRQLTKSTCMGTGAYDAEADAQFHRANVHGYFMEYDSERAGGFEPLRLVPKGKTVVLGLVTSKSGPAPPREAWRLPSSVGSTRRRSSARSTNWRCRRNAASPRPRRATPSPRTSNGRNCA